MESRRGCQKDSLIAESRFWEMVEECDGLKEDVGAAEEAQAICEQEIDHLHIEVARLQDLLLEVYVYGDSQLLQRQAAEVERHKKEIPEFFGNERYSTLSLSLR